LLAITLLRTKRNELAETLKRRDDKTCYIQGQVTIMEVPSTGKKYFVYVPLQTLIVWNGILRKSG
jgi:hypothetical protein